MSTDRETTRLVRSWLADGVTRLPDRVLDAVLDQVPATPQRRSWRAAWRPSDMPTYARLLAAAAAVFVVAVVGYQLLPGRGGTGGPATAAPSPSPVVLARGQFVAKGADVDLDATGPGDQVRGTMTVDAGDAGFAVDLECGLTSADGRILIAGDTTASTMDFAKTGTRTAIILKRGSPVHASFWFQSTDPPAATCLAFLESIVDRLETSTIGPDALEPIVGTVELGP